MNGWFQNLNQISAYLFLPFSEEVKEGLLTIAGEGQFLWVSVHWRASQDGLQTLVNFSSRSLSKA